MINNYNSLSWRSRTYLKNRELEVVGNPPDTAASRTLQSWLTNLLLIVCFLTIGSSLNAQVLIDPAGDGGFNNGTTFASNGWTVSNFATSTNRWETGTAVTASPFSGRSAYISQDGGTTTSYSLASSNHVYFYRDVAIPSGSVFIPLSFTWQGNGESTWDMIQVFVAPTTITPVAGAHPGSGLTNVPASITGATLLGSGLNLATAPQTANFVIPASFAGQTVRLIFMWKSDTSGGVQPPGAIDNISLSASNTVPTRTATALGGLWSSPATWVGGLVPNGTDATIPAGSVVTIDQVVSCNNLIVDGTVQWNATANTLTTSGNLTVNLGGRLLAHTSTSAGVSVTVGGSTFQNDGFANFALSSLSFNNASGGTLTGSGSFLGDGSKGIIRSLNFNCLGSSTISTTQDLVTTFGLAHTAGSLNTNGKLTIDNTAQVYGQAVNLQVSSVAVTNMGSLYSVAPVVFGTAVTQYNNGLSAASGTRYVSGSNVYLCTGAGTFNATPPTSTNLQATFTTSGPTLLYIGTVGTLGTNLPFNNILSTATQYFHGDNVYQATTTAQITSAANMPVHTSGVVGNLRYLGTVAKASVNWDSATGTVRSLNLTQAGSGFSTAPAITFSIGAVGATGSGAAATAVVFQSIIGTANSLVQKSGGAATISGGLTINSDQGASVLAPSNPQSSAGVGAISTTNGGLNYTVAPTVGFAGPTALNLVLNPGSGYAAAPTVVVTGGNLVSGLALTSANFTITVNSGRIQSVYLNAGTFATYSTPPTLAFSTGTATLAFPAGCWPTATANIGSNGQLTSFTVTNSGYGYHAAPTVGIGGGTFTTAATAPTCRIGLYNLTLNFFTPAAAAVVSADDAAIPANRKINVLTLGGNGRGLNLAGPLTVYANTGALVLNASGNAPGNILDLGGNNIYFSGNSFGGTTPTFGATNAYIRNGSMTLTGRGGASSFNFPFSGNFNWFAGSTPTPVTTGSNATIVTVSDTAAPTNATLGNSVAIGSRAYRVQLGQIGAPGFLVNPVTGTNPTVTMNFNSVDALTGVTADQLFISDATALSGAWTLRSAASGTGALPATGSRTTATVAPGPIAPTLDSYYAWSTSAPTITSVAPTTVCANSGAFTITGTNLTGVSAVSIGGTPVTSFTVVSATSITGFAGSGSDGFVTITKGGATVTGTDFITVSPTAGAPTVSTSAVTVNLGGTVSVTASGGAGTFNWYNVPAGGTSLFTGAAYSLPACASGTLYVAENNGSCEGARTPVAVTVVPTVIAATPATFCGVGGTVSLSVTPSDPSITYTWTALTPSATFTGSNVGETVSATVTENSDFQVTATNGSCTATSIFSVSVYPLPTATVTTTANGVCPGTSATIGSGLSAGNFSVTCISAPSVLSTPPPSAVTLTSGGTASVALSGGSLDDGFWNALPIGFSFNYFGTQYTTLNIGTNGSVNFGAAGSTQFSFVGGFPSTSNPANTIAVCARDLQLGAVGGNFAFGGGAVRYWTEGIAPNRRFVVQYDNCATWYSTNSTDGFNSTEAVFYETTGFVDIRVIRASNPAATTGTFINDTRNKFIGLQDGTRTIGATANNCSTLVPNFWNGSSAEILTPQAWRFSPPSNYTVTWFADTGSGPVQFATGTNIFNQTVAPLVSTTYSISYTNQTTGCTNALGSAQVLMGIVSNVAPTTTAVATPATVCAGSSTTLTLTGNVNNLGNTAGLTYQWQEDTGAGFTNITGATADTFVATPTAVTSYRCVVTACIGTPVAGNPVTVTGTNDISGVGSSVCGFGQANLTATSTTPGATIAWYAAPTGGTALATGSPFQPTVSATTTYYVAAETTGPNCSSFRVPVTATVTTPAVPLTLSSSAATFCSGGSAGALLTSGSGFYDTYTWAPATGVTGDEFVGWTFSPATSTTYTLTASQTGGLLCQASATFAVTVDSANVTAAVSDDTICIPSSTTLSATSLGIATGPQTAPIGYAASNATSPADEDILNVTFGSLNNSSTCATTGGAGSVLNQYSDYTAVAAPTVVAGATIPISVSVGTCGGNFNNFTNVYIDYNRNGVFDASELAFSSPASVVGPHLVTGSITIPLTASAGVTRMRVFVVEFGNAASPPTGTYSWGETEDYNVNIIGQTDVTSTYSYSWTSVPSGFTATGSSVSASPAVTTVYTVTATSPSGCSTTGSVTVNVSPAVDNITGGAAAMCIGSGTIDFDNTTVGVTWTSSVPSVASVDANGVVTALTTGTTVIGALIFNSDPAYNCTTFAANPQTLTVFAPLAISLQPFAQSVLPATVATFSIAASGSIVSYQWEVSPNGTSGWTALSNDSTYSGVLSNTLTINADTPLNGLYYRCVVTGNSPCATPLESLGAQLSVNTLAVSNPASVVLCTSGAGTANFTVTFTGATPDAIGWEIFDGSTYQLLDGTETGLGAVTYTGESTATLQLSGLSVVNNGWAVRAIGVVNTPFVQVTSGDATITVNTPASITSQPGNQSACYSGATAAFTVVATGATGFQWQYSTSATGPWTNVVNGTPAGATYTGDTTATLSVVTTNATPAAGTYFYQAVLSSQSACGDVSSAAAQLLIKTPEITASASSAVICQPGGTPVTLTGSGAGSGGTYLWSPATGLSGTTGDTVIANPAVTTTYTLTGTDATGCSNTATVTITVSDAVTATASATPATVCSGANSQLLASVGGAATTVDKYVFSTTTGALDTMTGATVIGSAPNDDTGYAASNIGFTFNYDGQTYTQFSASPDGFIRLGSTTASNQFTNSMVSTINIPKIAAYWDDVALGGAGLGGEVSVVTTGTAPNRICKVQWLVTIPRNVGGTPNSQFQLWLYEANGLVEMRYGAMNSAAMSATVGLRGATTFNSVTIDTNSASTTVANDLNSSQPGQSTIYRFTPPSYTYSWSPATFLSSTTIANPVATAVTANTTYTVTVTSSAGCSATATTSVTLSSAIEITTQPADASFCQGTTATLSVVATGASLTYQWRKGGVDILGQTAATLSIPNATPADSGSYDVVINDICGSPAVTSSAAVLTINPTPTVASPGNQLFCSGVATAPIVLTGTPSGVTYNIAGGAAIGLADQTGATSIPSFTPLVGTATISVTPVANACSGTAVTFTITVNETPSAVVVSPSAPTIACGGDPVLLSAAGGIVAPSAYCVPTVTQVGATNDNITNFTFAGINNTTGDGPGDYNAYLSPSAVVTAGIATPFSITPNPAFGQQFRVWVDMNQNGVFEATESVFATTASSTVTVSGNITIPTTAFNGTTRLRIGDKFSSAVAATEACGHTGFGEYEDYTVTISGATPAPTGLFVWTSTGGGLFTDAAGTVAYTGTPAATVYANPAASATITATATVAGCTSSGSAAVTIEPCESIVNLKLFIEGYYDATNAGFMKPVKLNQWDGVTPPTAPTNEVVDITVDLYDASTLTLVTSTTALLLTDGTAVCTFASAPSGSFYLTVRGSNFVQTWTAAPVSVGSTPLTYDFSDAANKALGDNMALVDTGVYGFFSGELNGDGNIDNADYLLWETDANNFAFGDFPTDLNGDGNVDNADYLLWETNANNFVFSVTPTP